MTSYPRNTLHKLYRYAKVLLNRLLDRLIDFCTMVLMDGYLLPWPALQHLSKCLARCLGDVSWLLRDLPRSSAFRLTEDDRTIVYVGGEEGLLEISHLFFGDCAKMHELGRVPCIKIQARISGWLRDGADLVVYEHGCISPFLSSAPIMFTVPMWIHQVLSLTDSLETFLSGSKMRNVRHWACRAEKAGLVWHFSTEKKDFDYFHHRMYVPLVVSRHGPRALVARYQDQWDRWFLRGGLIVATQGEQRVGGLLCYVQAGTCHAVEVGILDGDPALYRQGLKMFLDLAAIQWAYQRGASIYDMGGTRPWCSDGIFTYKSRWRARVTRRVGIHGEWTFAAHRLRGKLQARINEVGFIARIGGRFYQIVVADSNETFNSADVQRRVKSAQHCGLAGIAVVRAGSEMVLCESSD